MEHPHAEWFNMMGTKAYMVSNVLVSVWITDKTKEV